MNTEFSLSLLFYQTLIWDSEQSPKKYVRTASWFSFLIPQTLYKIPTYQKLYTKGILLINFISEHKVNYCILYFFFHFSFLHPQHVSQCLLLEHGSLSSVLNSNKCIFNGNEKFFCSNSLIF